jgi:hypothetical protein
MILRIKFDCILLALGLFTLLVSSQLLADRAGECSRLWQQEKNAGCPVMPPENSVDAYPAPKSCENFMVTSDFGPTKCVIEENLDNEKRGLKKECENWVKERKTDLGNKFLTSTCSPECTPCPKNEILRHCTFRGEVHYSIK